jgi:hypothetical protein
MKTNNSRRLNKFKTLTLASVITLASTYSLAELNQVKKVYTQNGYPYEALVDRSQEVKIFYTEQENNVRCRVEVIQDGQVWKGEAQIASAKKFSEKPLRACINRNDAKKLLAKTF